MTVSLTTRLGLTRWSSDLDAWSREQIDGNMGALEALAIIGTQGPQDSRPAAGVQRRLYLTNDTERLYLDDGDEWLEVLIAGTANATAVAFTPTGGIAATTVAAALAELDTEKATTSALADHVNDTTAAHTAAAIGFTPTGSIAATDVQAALAEVSSEAGNNLTAHTGAAAGAHAATAISFTPAGGISATTVAAALAELDTEKAPKASPVFTGAPATAPAAATDEASAIALVNYLRDRLIAVGLIA